VKQKGTGKIRKRFSKLRRDVMASSANFKVPDLQESRH
jgi:hypothetical protein